MLYLIVPSCEETSIIPFKAIVLSLKNVHLSVIVIDGKYNESTENVNGLKEGER